LTQERPHKKHTKSNHVSEKQQGSLAHQSHGASWGCTLQNGCYTYVLLMHARPHQKHTKKHQSIRNEAKQPCPPRSDAFSTHAFGRGKFTIEWVHTSVSSM
jgi:hypothetical protein